MAQGEIRWSSQGKQAKKFDREPVRKGSYDLKLDGSTVEVRPGSEPGKLPHVVCLFSILGTGSPDGGKDRRVLHRFFLNMEAAADGSSMVERADGVLGYTRSVGEEPEFGGRMAPYIKKDKKGNVLESKQVPILDPQELATWLKEHDGVVTRAFIGIERSEGYDPRNKIQEFEEATTVSSGPDSDYSMDSEETPDGGLTAEADDEEDAEVEEAPRKLTAVRPAPAKKVAGKKR